MISSEFFIYLLIIIQIYFPGQYCTDDLISEQSRPTLKKEIFGIKLRSSSSVLLAEVESLFGKAVCVKLMRDRDGCTNLMLDSEGYIKAHSKVAQDGTPVILLDDSHQTEEVLVHELFHLKLFANGFPELKAGMWVNQDDEINSKFIYQLEALIRDTIQHWRFYPEMRRMGFRHHLGGVQEFKSAMERGHFENVTTGNEWLFLPLFYYKAYLEFSDEKKLLAQIDEWYKAKKWDYYAKIGDELVQVIKELKPLTPQTEYDAFLRCANIINQGRAKFDEREWRTERKGDFVQHIAPYLITPFDK